MHTFRQNPITVKRYVKKTSSNNVKAPLHTFQTCCITKILNLDRFFIYLFCVHCTTGSVATWDNLTTLYCFRLLITHMQKQSPKYQTYCQHKQLVFFNTLRIQTRFAESLHLGTIKLVKFRTIHICRKELQKCRNYQTYVSKPFSSPFQFALHAYIFAVGYLGYLFFT